MGQRTMSHVCILWRNRQEILSRIAYIVLRIAWLEKLDWWGMAFFVLRTAYGVILNSKFSIQIRTIKVRAKLSSEF